MGKLTTHVLDTAHGCPASGIGIRLFDIGGQGDILLCEAKTNADGRSDGPLLSGAQFKAGHYRLEFSTAEYFRARGVRLSEPPFLDVIELRFAVADASENFHVPLLVSPFSYSTYRGS